MQHKGQCIYVVGGDQQLVGVITEHDLLAKGLDIRGRAISILADRLFHVGELAHRLDQARNLRATDVMESGVITIRPDSPLKEVVQLLLKHRINRVPVVEGGRILGSISLIVNFHCGKSSQAHPVAGFMTCEPS